MSILKITQTTQDGRKKIWKVESKQSLMTFGSSRKSDVNSIDRLSSPFDAVIEHRADGWHFISFDIKNPNPDLRIVENQKINFAESELTFNILTKEEFVLKSLENIANTKNAEKSNQKKILVVTKNNKVLKTEVKDLSHQFKYSIAGATHSLPFVGQNQWEYHEIEGFQFKSKLVNVADVAELEKVSTEQMLDKESKKMLIATLAGMFLFVAIGILAPGNKTDLSEMITLPKSSSELTLKVEPKKQKKLAGTVNVVKNQQPIQKQNNTAPSAGGGKVSALLKGAVGVRISQLIGKVSATEARTAQVLVTTSGAKAGEGASGRALAAVGNVESSGRNWNGEATANGGGKGVSTAGVGGGKGAGGLGQGLAAGKTGSGGVGLIEEESEIVGGLDREVIAQYIKSQLGQILYCYERQLSANPELYGKVAVKFTISGNGQVESQAINQTTLKSVPVEGCILSKVAKWKFPEPKGGTKVVVTYPFLFKSTN